MALLKIANLKKSYYITKTQKQDVLKGVDIEFKSGDLVALLGESGCGKSTLINILGGLDMDYTGSIVIKGDYIRDFSEKQLDDYRKKRVGLIFQNYNLIGHSTIIENVELAMSISDIDEKTRKERALDLLKLVGLGNFPDKYPSQLSGGQKQRVAIARALANNPTIILADEPTGALDKESADLVMKILKKISESGKLVIIVTHSEKVADECGRVIRLDDGVIVEDKVIRKLHIDKERDKEIIPRNMKKKDLFNWAKKNVGRNKKRSMLTAIGMAVGIAAMMLILCLSSGLTGYVNTVYGEKGSSLQIQVQNKEKTSINEDDAYSIENLSGVESVTITTRFSEATAEYGEKSETVGVTGYYENFIPSILYGEVPNAVGEIVIDEFTATRLSSNKPIAIIGESITLTVDGLIKNFTVTGICENQNSKTCYIMQSDVDEYADGYDNANNLLFISIKDTTYVSAVVSDIKSLGLSVTEEETSVKEVLNYIDLGTNVLTGVGGISMVVSAIMIFIVLYISVSERTKEIGILRSIGARKKDIKRMFIYEAGILGLVGGLIAVASCVVVSTVVNIVCYVSLSCTLIDYNVFYYLFGVAVSVIISILAGVAPSMRAADLDPVECLRTE